MFDSEDDTIADDNSKSIFPRCENAYFSPSLKLADFQRKRYIARGAFGKVEQYYSPQKQQNYAIKMMKYDTNSIQSINEIKRELDILYKINSPYLVKLFDHFEDEKAVYLVMEYVEGNNLCESIFKPRIELQMRPIAKIIYQICEALEQLHKQKIVHRDIKLENILLLSDQSIKVVDLGQSNHFGEGIDRMSKRGTKPYFCPQILNREQQDDRIDSWCVGVVLYQLICMSSPFQQQTQVAMQEKIRRFSYPIPERIKYEKQLLDLFSKIFTWKSQRLRVTGIKNHPFIKKYMNSDNGVMIRFENTFTQSQTAHYRQFLQSEIERYRNSYKSLIEENKQIQDLVEKTEKKIFGFKNLV